MSNTDTLNPSPENDAMRFRDMLHQAATFFVSLSEQAAAYRKEIEALKVDLAEVKDRVTSALAENQRLRDELYRTVAERDKAQKEAADNGNLAQAYANDLAVVKNDLNEVTLGRDDFKTRLGTSEYVSAQTQRDRDYWRSRCTVGEDRATAAEAKLAKLQAQFKAVFEGAVEDSPLPVEVAKPIEVVQPHPVDEAQHSESPAPRYGW